MVLLAGCDSPSDTGLPDSDPPGGSKECPPGELLLEDGTCRKAGPPEMPCPPGELLLEGGACQKAGVPPSECGVGFMPDGNDGCEPILPADPCPEGQMAIPGDTECHEVAPCASGTWGDIPVEANTEFVDQAYAGGGSDGTQAKPWTTVQQGVNAAAKGAIVAVAAGAYSEDVVIAGKPVRLWGRCPAMVEVAGIGTNLGAIMILKNAGDTEIRSIAVTGAKVGIGVSGAIGVAIEGVWVHATGHHGLAIQDEFGPTSVAITGSLVEQATQVGVIVDGAEATLEATVVRSTVPDAQGLGRGVSASNHLTTKTRAGLIMRSCLVEQNSDVGVIVNGSDATFEATVVRSTMTDAPLKPAGIVVQSDPGTAVRANAKLRGCLVEKNRGTGLLVVASDATFEATVVRSTLTDAQESGGNGIRIEDEPATEARSNVTVRACLVEQTHQTGVFVQASDATFEATVVRATAPVMAGTPEEVGFGILIQDDPETAAQANVTVRACLVEKNHVLGVAVKGSEAMIESTVVRSTLPDAQGNTGRGIDVQNDLETMVRASVTVRACLVEQNREVGVFVEGSDAIIEATVVRSTLPDMQGDAGHGIMIRDDVATKAHANVAVRACLVEQNQGMGVAIGGSDGTIESSVVRSNLLDAQAIGGAGVTIQNDPAVGSRADVTVRGCVIEQNHSQGILVAGSDATIESTVVRSNLPDANGEFGRGIGVQRDEAGDERAKVTVRACLVEQNQDTGIFVFDSDVTIETSTVRGTTANSDGQFVGRFGDGISVELSYVTIQNVEVTGNARAGISSFGGKLLITGGVIACNPFDLEGEVKDDIPFSFDGSTGWKCSGKPPAECSELDECHVESVGIAAPVALTPVDPLPPDDPPMP